MNETNRSGLFVGVLLVLAGLVFLAEQVLHVHIAAFAWPLLVIGFGGAFFLGMLLGGKSLGALAIPGTIITGIGAILLVQNSFNLWDSWSYAWALIVIFVGLGLFIHGSWSGISDLRVQGLRVMRIGAILFLVFGAFFGLLFSLTGVYGLRSGIFWSVVLVVLGGYLFIDRIFRLFRKEGDDYNRPVHFFWPVVFIGVGLLWFLVAINVLPSNQAVALLNLWPVLLIVGGLNLMIGRRYPLVNLALGLLVVAGLFFFAFAGPAFGLTRLNWMNNSIFRIDAGLPFQTIRGSGHTTAEGREISGFDRVQIKSIGEAEIVQGENDGVVIDAEDNLIPYITTSVFAGELIIDVKPGVGIDPTQPVRYQITVKNLKEVRTSGAAKVSIRSLKVPALDISTSGIGEIQITDLQASTLNAETSGTGSIHATGTVDQTSIRVSGTGSIDAPDLKTKTSTVNISGVGSATLWVTDKLETNISGAGSVNYYGSPSLVENISGLGSAHSLGSK